MQTIYLFLQNGYLFRLTLTHHQANKNVSYKLSKEKTNLMPLILLFIQYSFNAQHVSAVNTTIFKSLRLTGCYFMGGICCKMRDQCPTF